MKVTLHLCRYHGSIDICINANANVDYSTSMFGANADAKQPFCRSTIVSMRPQLPSDSSPHYIGVDIDTITKRRKDC
ncbi:hypothetical protein B296_00012082 [Ensete ventricosum]|uniref:Uncharacterized protein n=1 Tax=Ensete ventricosum TaxID=4639 RepID=A0A426Z2D9_ENSVE|nr:hypothetical protein B296_00012082 [Ensete ventricosum]